ncbi:MAG: BMP family ABC transporter substrate-binding protein [Clostridiales bacterium]|nr:BMP family ABC transporter substrate-binding protein [Clostridiales bacterium]
MARTTFASVDEQAYSRAQKLASKAYHAAVQKGENPYLPVLDEILPDQLALTHVDLGLITIPLDRVVGTGTKGRTSAFAVNFMPLLSDGSEFAAKWSNLYHSVIEDGVRDPVKALEYMNKYYILEGNKRISVLKYTGAVMIEAQVTRIIPKRTEDRENRIYFEYLDFYRDSKVNYIYFSEEGSFAKLTELVGQTPGEPWSDDARAEFGSAFQRFLSAYELAGGDLLGITPGDAFLIYLQVYGYDRDQFLVSADVRARISKLKDEFKTKAQSESFSLLMNPQGQKPGLLKQIIHPAPSRLSVGFVNNRAPESSGWTYWHELGKNRIESVFGARVETRMVSNVAPEDCQQAIEDMVAEGVNIVFTTSPVLLDGAMKAAIAHPEIKVLNCSLLPSYKAVRSYYLRMYEAKFIIGAIAGAMAGDDAIGLIADYPVYGKPASVNAFALGARLTNPRAKVYLEWSTVKDADPLAHFRKNGVRVICNRDISAPSHASKEFGLYAVTPDGPVNLAMPVWNWGRLYEDLLRRIQNGVWTTDTSESNPQALNYWWGMSEGAIDVFYSSKLDAGTRRLADWLRHSVRDGAILPFSELIRDQAGNVRCTTGDALTPAEIIAMDYLCDNVVGTIPGLEDMKPEAQAFVRMQGVKAVKAPDASEICWTEPGEGMGNQ